MRFGVLRKIPYQKAQKRYEYILTQKGLEAPCARSSCFASPGYFRISGICRLVGLFCSVSKPRPSILRAPQNSRSPRR